MDFEAISDRILIIPDKKDEWAEKEPQTGIVHSVGNVINGVKPKDHVAYAKGNHPVQGEYKVLRQEQIYAILL